MSDDTRPASPVTTDRVFSTEDLAYINRMTTTGLVLPSVAHEINNSLQIIAGMAEILGLRGQLPPEVADKAQKIAVQANKAAGVLRDLVAFSRRDGVAPRVDLRAAVDRALALRRYYLSRGKVDVEVEAAGGEAFLIEADSQFVVQILVNLVINAEEAVATQESRQLRFRIWRQDGHCCCELRDSGAGLGEAAASAGQPFFTTKPGGAAGLGLAVASRLIAEGGGRFAVSQASPVTVLVSWPAA